MAAGCFSAGSAVTASYREIPIAFEENRGQRPPVVRFLAQASNYRLMLAPSGLLVEPAVLINGYAAPIFSLYNVEGRQQVTIQIPWEFVDTIYEYTIVVVNQTVPGYQVRVPNAFVNPGVFAWHDGYGAILHTSDYSVVTPENPARPGEIVAIYATGLGYVPSPPPTGMPASASPLSRCGWEYRARVAGVAGETLFCGLAPGYAGLYQLNVRLPQNLASGLHDLVLERAKFSDYYRAPPVKIAVAAAQTQASAVRR